MDNKQILEIIKGGETQTTEFKRTSNKDVGKTLCAFSNINGGLLIIGVEDNGQIIGIQSSKQDEIQQQIYHSQQECNPTPVCSISLFDTEKGKIFLVKVPKLGSGICYYKNEIYVRVGTTDHKIAGPAIEDFLKKKQILCFEDDFIDARLEDLDQTKIKEYLKKRNPSISYEENKLKSVLATLRVASLNEPFQLKKSAILLFGRQISQFIPQNQVKLVRFKGSIAVDILDMTNLSETIVDNIEQSIKFVLKHIKKEFRIQGVRREEILEYPIVALREAIVNAIIHRDYYSQAATQINIFDDRIEISNPGALPRELKVRDLPFLGLGIPRNPTLYRLLSDINIVEGLGTGFPRMFQAMRSQGLPDPHPEDFGTIFKLTLYNTFPLKKEGFNERQLRAINYTREHKVITSNKFQQLYKVSKPTAVSDLVFLVKRGFLRKVGKGRSTHYTIKESLNI